MNFYMIKAEKVKWWNRWLLVFFGGVHTSDLVEVESELLSSSSIRCSAS